MARLRRSTNDRKIDNFSITLLRLGIISNKDGFKSWCDDTRMWWFFPEDHRLNNAFLNKMFRMNIKRIKNKQRHKNG